MPHVPFVRTFVLDLETVPIEDACDFIEPPSAPENYKDPAKIADYIRNRRIALIEDAGLDIDLARICAFGIAELNPTYDGEGARLFQAEPSIHSVENEDQERALLKFMREPLESGRLITFCGAGFDLPLLARRYCYLGLPPLSMELDRYKSPHVDLYERLKLRGLATAHKLSWYVKRLGWSDLENALKGADVAQAVREGEWPLVLEHLRCDVVATGRLAAWMGVLASLPAVPAGRWTGPSDPGKPGDQPIL